MMQLGHLETNCLPDRYTHNIHKTLCTKFTTALIVKLCMKMFCFLEVNNVLLNNKVSIKKKCTI